MDDSKVHVTIWRISDWSQTTCNDTIDKPLIPEQQFTKHIIKIL